MNETQIIYNDGMEIAICSSTHDKNYDPLHDLCIGEETRPLPPQSTNNTKRQ